MSTTYKGIPFLKNPFDVVIYMQLFAKLRPRTVIEIGTKFGGSAVWFADMMTVHGLSDGRVISVDIDPISVVSDPRITFLQGDAKLLSAALPKELLEQCSRPWLVVEDSSHFYAETSAVLTFFRQRLQSGDYMVVEDGIVSQMPGEIYAKYEDGPNRAVSDFLNNTVGEYVVDEALCDHFGENVTYNPNGWLRKIS